MFTIEAFPEYTPNIFENMLLSSHSLLHWLVVSLSSLPIMHRTWTLVHRGASGHSRNGSERNNLCNKFQIKTSIHKISQKVINVCFPIPFCILVCIYGKPFTHRIKQSKLFSFLWMKMYICYNQKAIHTRIV